MFYSKLDHKMANKNDRRSTPPSGWLHKADISWALHNKHFSNQDKASKVVKVLSGMEQFKSPEHRTVLDAVVEGAKQGNREFEEALEVLYNFCDYHSIWLAS